MKKYQEMMIALLDRLEEVDSDYYSSDLVTKADDLLKEIEDGTVELKTVERHLPDLEQIAATIKEYSGKDVTVEQILEGNLSSLISHYRTMFDIKFDR